MKNPNYSDSVKRNAFLWILFSAITAGIFAGAIYSTGHSVTSPWIHQYFLPEYSGGTIYEVFRNTFVSLGAFTVTAFLMDCPLSDNLLEFLCLYTGDSELV